MHEMSEITSKLLTEITKFSQTNKKKKVFNYELKVFDTLLYKSFSTIQNKQCPYSTGQFLLRYVGS